MKKATKAKGRLLRFEVLESRSFPSVALPLAPMDAAASGAVGASVLPAARPSAAAVVVNAASISPTSGNAGAASSPGNAGDLPYIAGSQSLFSPLAASAEVTLEAALPGANGGLVSTLATMYGTQQSNSINTQDPFYLYFWLLGA